jgi:hypothetical protein
VTILQALAILEAAVLECKKRNVDTTEMREALNFLEPHIYPKWLIPQYRDHVTEHDRTNYVALERQQQVLRATFPGIRESVRVLFEVRVDRLARRFLVTKDMMVRDEIYRLRRELIKLNQPWKVVVI